MAVELLRPAHARRRVSVALVNNMPDGAFTDTEDQFRRLLCAAGADVDLSLYTITEMPRSDPVTLTIKDRYRGLDELWDQRPDALLVTGTEPTQADMRSEPYWPHLARLLEWAAECVPTVLLSCLAAHASILFFDGIERRRRPVKCSGVFPGRVTGGAADPLARRLPKRVLVPHSRINEVPQATLADAGYRILIGGDAASVGWSLATRARGDSLFVLCQGHPEYGTLSLLREYRRDVRRYLLSQGAFPYPHLPDGYVRPAAVSRLADFAAMATSGDHDPQQLWAGFPYRDIAATVENTWFRWSAMLYANWLGLARQTSAAVA